MAEKSGAPGRTHRKHGKNTQKIFTERRCPGNESNLGPTCCEATLLTYELPCSQLCFGASDHPIMLDTVGNDSDSLCSVNWCSLMGLSSRGS